MEPPLKTNVSFSSFSREKETLVNCNTCSVDVPLSSENDHTKPTIDKKNNLCVTILSTISFLAAIASIGAVLFLYNSFKKYTPAVVYKDNQLCVPCRMIGDTRGVIKYNVQEGHEQICCFPNSSGTSEIRQALESIALTETRDTRENSFHVYYSEAPTKTKKRDVSAIPVKLNHWATKGNRIHVGERISHDDDEGLFTVTATGNYMIYSHMSYQPPPHVLLEHAEKGTNLTFLFSNKVLVKSKNSEDKEVIMEDGAEAMCRIRQQYGGQLYPCHVSNLVSMMPLNKGDTLSVEAAPAQYLLGDLKSTYFGLFLIG